jgi:peptide/nickel transport system substrate-binding protein
MRCQAGQPQWPGRQTLHRRRLLARAVAGAGGLAGLMLAACGGDGDTGTAPGAVSGATGLASAAPAEQIKRGGVARVHNTNPPPTLDPRKTPGFTIHHPARLFYSKLYKGDDIPGEVRSGYRGDLAATLPEVPNPDGLTQIVKLRPNAVWHDLPPLRGRLVTARDVVSAYEFWVGEPQNPVRGAYTTVIDRLEAVDAQTVVVKLKTPYTPLVSLLAHWSAGMWLLSPEVDPETAIVGTGPFMVNVEKGGYQKDIKFTMQRAPAYYIQGADGKSLPYLDSVEMSIINDPNVVIAQFTAGRLDISGFSHKNLAQVTGAVRGAQVVPVPNFTMTYGFFDPRAYTEKSTPMADVRVRRALSMALDRPALIKVAYGAEDQGGPATCFPWKFDPWWSDPAGTELGEAAKWLTYDPEGAKRLLAEAGHASGFDLPLHYTTERYGPDYAAGAQAVASMLGKVGVRARLNDQPSNVFITTTFVAKFEGLGWSLETPYYEPDDYLFNFFHPQGRATTR